MGKITGFLEIDRNDRHYAPVEERVRHWKEFVLPLGEKGTQEQAARDEWDREHWNGGDR